MNMAVMKIGDFVDVVGRPVQVEAPANPEFWYLLRVHAMKERKVQQQLQRSNVRTYLPTYTHDVRVHRRWRQWTEPKMRRVTSPLFPGLLFVPDYDAAAWIAENDHVIGYLKFGEVEARMTDKLMEKVREIERTGGIPLSKLKKGLEPGDKVRIKEGIGHPFEMWTGRFQRVDGKHRLRVLLNAVSREVPIIVSADQVEPV